MKALLFIILLLSCRAADIYPVGPSGSMKPWFDENYLLYVERTPFHDIRIGDVIIYSHKNKPFVFRGVTYLTTVHKVYRKSSSGNVVLCWGVNNIEPDSYFITEDMYVGTALKWVTKDEYFRPEFKWENIKTKNR